MPQKKLFLRLFLPALLLLIAAAIALYFWLFTGLPSLDTLSSRLNLPSVRITDRDGRLLYEAIAEEGGRHTVVALSAIPLDCQNAIIATEDAGFYTNPGVDLRGILRAFWINLTGGETLAGGSTITQQVARNLLLEADERAERTLRRKLRESILAWQLARQYAKDEILATYLNQIYFGGMAYGIEAAAQTYFGESAGGLDLAECALLAGLPQAPALYNPFTDPQAAKTRQLVVLRLMEEQEYIDAEQFSLAEREPLVYASTPYPMQAPHFVMMVLAQVDGLITTEQIYEHGGITVRTTLNLDWQRLAEKAIDEQIASLQRPTERSLDHNIHNAALVALDTHSGEILALVGNADYFDADHAGAINMVIAPRQPGSALKPLVYATALDPARPEPWTAATMILDVQTSFITHEGDSYVPKNYDNQEHGPVLLRDALGSSLNIPAVITLEHIGLDALFTSAAKLGMTTLAASGDPGDFDLSLALGGGEVRLMDLTAAYGAFANGGYRLVPFAITEITDPAGNLLFEAAPAPQERVLDERLAWLISDMLSDDDARIIGFGANSLLRLDRPAAVKTGTTSNFHDNWTVGYTTDLVVGVWAGNTSYEPMRNVTGLTGAAPIWHQFLRSALQGEAEQPFVRPDGLTRVEVCALSGLLPTDACPYRRLEWFVEGTQPVEYDTFYRVVEVDSATGRLADANTPAEWRVRRTVLDLPPQAFPWARAHNIPLLADLSTGSGQSGAPGATALSLLSPAPNAVYRLTAGLPADTQRLRLEAASGLALVEVTFYVDGEAVGIVTESPFAVWWALRAGTHTVWAEGVTAAGERILSERVAVEVKP